ncbi:MAG: M20 family metallopeptidase [Magnetococcales bacterium]|nr:M20 family metallopeptidase [Magnetococcales bacterium]
MNILEDLKTVVTINSHTGNKPGVDQVGQQFEKWFKAIGFKLTRYSRSHIGDHLHFCSTLQKGHRLLLLGHLDTVFPAGKFEIFRQDDEWVYGPGVCDMKGGLIVVLESLRQVHVDMGCLKNIDILLVSDEETGSDDSKILTAQLAPNYDACFVFEASGPKGELVTGRKGVGTFTLEVEGKSAHAGNSYSLGINANLSAARIVEKLTGLTDLSKSTTVNVGKMQGGISANTISPQASLLFEIRYQHLSERDRLLNSINKIIEEESSGCKFTLGGGIQRDVMTPTASQTALLEKLMTISGEHLLTEKRGGVSDANITSSIGVPTLDGFGPFGDGDHTFEERASIKSLHKRIELLTTIFKHFQKSGEIK